MTGSRVTDLLGLILFEFKAIMQDNYTILLRWILDCQLANRVSSLLLPLYVPSLSS